MLENEPPGTELARLVDVPNLLLTHHMVLSSRQYRRKLVDTIAGHLQALVEGPWQDHRSERQGRSSHHGTNRTH